MVIREENVYNCGDGLLLKSAGGGCQALASYFDCLPKMPSPSHANGTA